MPLPRANEPCPHHHARRRGFLVFILMEAAQCRVIPGRVAIPLVPKIRFRQRELSRAYRAVAETGSADIRFLKIPERACRRVKLEEKQLTRVEMPKIYLIDTL